MNEILSDKLGASEIFKSRAQNNGALRVEREDGAICFYRNGKLHNIDAPAVIKPCETEEWYRNGRLHRIGGPAVEIPGGAHLWYRNGKLHRVDGPAVKRLCANGHWMFEWFRDGVRHRDDGPAMTSFNYEAWYRDGKLHRDNGPAYRNDNIWGWYRDGQLHRTDGPAWIEGSHTKTWFSNGIAIEP